MFKNYQLPLLVLAIVFTANTAFAASWTTVAPKSIASSGATAILLPNGKVLVSSTVLPSSTPISPELYDPTTNTWSATGSMVVARRSYTTTLLPNGKVLAAGGYGDSGYLTSAELYDSTTNTWTATGSMVTARSGHSATRMYNGYVLVTGGYTGGFLSNAELYNPLSGTWSVTGDRIMFGFQCYLTPLANGKVLLTPERTPTVGASNVELYDLATLTWSATGAMTTARSAYTPILLTNGKVLVVGGTGYLNSNSSAAVSLSSAELYDPTTGTWSATGAMTTARSAYTPILLTNGKVLVVGGTGYLGGSMGAPVSLSSAELYDPTTGRWSATSAMTTGRSASASALLPDGKVLVAGGYDGGYLASAELFDPNSQAPTNIALFAATAYENSVRGTTIGTFSATDIDTADSSTNETFTYALATGSGDTDNASFSITGTLLKTATTFSFITKSSYSIRVRVTDSASLTFEKVFTISIVDVNDAPTFTKGADQKVIENCGPQTVANWATGFNPGPANEASQTALAYLVTNNKNALFSAQPTIATNGALTFTPATNAYGTAIVTVQVQDSGGTANGGVDTSTAQTFTLRIDGIPTVSASASPTALLEGATSSFSATGVDPDGDPLVYAWNFGDGSSSAASADNFSIAHTYSTAGVYSATATVTDAAGSSATSTAITINVFKTSALPTARFTTSDVVGFVGQPLTFDSTLSTDPKNSIPSYSWDFGDGSATGKTMVLSKIYDTVGTYSVSLTITNSDGLSATSTRDLVILPADQVGIFNTAIDYKVRWDRTKENADSITLTATINVGDAVIAKGTTVGFTIVGQSFSAILDGKLRNKTSTANWQVTANTRKQSAGEVLIKVTIKKANLGLAFNAAGVVAGSNKNSKTTVEATIPLTIEIAGKTFEMEIDSTFKFSDEGKKSSGAGNK